MLRGGYAADLIIGLMFAGLGSAIFIIASGFRTLPGMVVGSGLFPSITGATMIAFGLLLALTAARSARRRATAAAPETKGERQSLLTAPALAVIAALVALIFVMPAAGFPATGFVFSVFLVRLGGGSWPGALTFSAAATAAIFTIFTYGLRVPLPGGPF